MRQVSRLLPIALLLLLVTGACRSGRNATDITGRYQSSLSDSTLSDHSDGTVYGRGIEWADLSVPVNVSIIRPTSLRIGGTMTMVNGRDILISLRMFGFEVGAAYVTADSVYAYAKMQRVYVAESINDALGGLDMSIADLQALLIGAPFTFPTAQSDIDISVSQSTGQPLTISISHPSGRTASIAYTPLEGAPLAEEIALSAISGRNELAASLSYDWSRAQVDKGDTRSFSIPRGYRRLSGASLLKSLGTKN